MSKYGLSEKEITDIKEKLSSMFDVEKEEIPDEAVLVNWEPEPTPGEIGRAKQLAEKIQGNQKDSVELDFDELVGKKIGRHDLKHGTDEYEDRNYIRGVKMEDGQLKVYTGYDPETNPEWGTFWEIVIHLEDS